MPVIHTYQSATPNNPAHEISSTRWNAAHTVSIVNADVSASAAIAESKLALSFATHAPPPYADTQTIIKGSADATKLLRFEVGGFTAGATRVLTPPNQNATIAGLEVANVFTANQIIDAHAAIGADAALDYNTFGSASASVSLSIVETYTTPHASGGHIKVGALSTIYADPSSNSAGTFYVGMFFNALSVAGNANNLNSLIGISGNSFHFGDGNLSYTAGVDVSVSNTGAGNIVNTYGLYSYIDHYGSGTVTNLYGQHFDMWLGGTITNVYGIKISPNNDGGTVTNAYGLYIDDVDAGSTRNYSIWTNAGKWWAGDDIEIANGKNFIFKTSTGTKIGTDASQKLSLWNATPIVQPTTAIAEATFVENAGGTAVNVDSTFDGYTVQQVVKALRNIGALA